MLEICLVGTGVIAAQHVKALSEIGGVRLRWVVASTPSKAQSFAREWSFDRCGTHLDEALDDSRINLVLIATPSEFHAQQAIQAFEAGKHVIVEIPVGLSLAEAEKVANVAEARGRRVLVCHTMRSFPAIQEVRRRVLDRELNLTQVNGYFAIPRKRNQNQAGQRSWIDNLLWHHGCHQVDAAMWVLGTKRGEHVAAVVGRAHPRFGMAVDVSLHFATPTRQIVTQSLTYNAEQLIWELRFVGNETTLVFRNGQLFDEEGKAVTPAMSWVDLRPQNSRMLEALHEGQLCEYDIREVMPAMDLLQRAEASAGGGV